MSQPQCRSCKTKMHDSRTTCWKSARSNTDHVSAQTSPKEGRPRGLQGQAMRGDRALTYARVEQTTTDTTVNLWNYPKDGRDLIQQFLTVRINYFVMVFIVLHCKKLKTITLFNSDSKRTLPFWCRDVNVNGEVFIGFYADSLPKLHFLHKTASVKVATFT